MPKSRGIAWWWCAAVALVALAWFAARGVERSRGHRQDEADLDRVWRSLSSRPVQGRIAGLDRYRPYTVPRPRSTIAPMRGPDAVSGLRGAQPVQAGPNAGERWLVALLRGARPDLVAPSLRGVAGESTAPDDWRAWNDLSVVLLEGSYPDKYEALESVQQAARLGGRRPEVVFNHALILRSLGSSKRAAAAWQEYLELDSVSEWAAEVRDHLATARSTSPPTPASAAARHRIERVLLLGWLEAVVDGSADARETAYLSLERVLERPGVATAMIRAAVDTIRRAIDDGDPALADLLEGHRLFARAEAELAAGELSLARSLYEDAATRLESAGSPFSLHSRVRRLWSVLRPNEKSIRALIQEADRGGFYNTAAQAVRVLAYEAALEGRLVAALEYYTEAARRFADAGAWEERAICRVMRAELLAELGRRDLALEELALATRHRDHLSDPWARFTMGWLSTSTLSFAGSFPLAALDEQRRLIALCSDLPARPYCEVDTRLALARLLPHDEMVEELARARTALGKIAPSEGRGRTEADLAARIGDLEARGPDRLRALRSYDRSLALYEALELPPEAVSVRVRRASLLEELDRHADARADLEAALREIRTWDRHGTQVEGVLGGPLLPQLRPLYEELIDHESRRDGEQAVVASLLLAEELRDRTAPRLRRELRIPTSRELERFVSLLDESTVAFEYLLSEDGGHGWVWILTHEGISRLELTFSRPPSELAGVVARAAGARDKAAWDEALSVLSAELLRPVLDTLPESARRLFIVPDGALQSIPFVALPDDRGSLLGERFDVALSPSLGMLLEASERGPGRSARGPVLSVGIALHDNLLLPDLPLAEEEARAVERHYGRNVLECGTDWESVRRCLGRASVVHLATHARVRAGDAIQSWLALSDQTVGVDRLWRDLGELEEGLTVVLSACESTSSAVAADLGGFARPFLAHGASTVVGTLWPIYDADAAAFFPAFHGHLVDTGSPTVAASRARAQLERWREEPWTWASVQVITTDLRGEESRWGSS